VNYGPEQERLNAVFGARLRISGLRAPVGPGIEFLEYLSPRDGRSAVGIKANDLAHWETTLAAPSADRAFERLRAGRWLVSPSVVPVQGQTGLDKGLIAVDPDGHAVKVVER
jgi:hypothetical protein